MSVLIRSASASDSAGIHAVHERAFGGPLEADLTNRLIQDGFAMISCVAEEQKQVVGHILFTPATIRTESHDMLALALAPLAVLPNFQQQGIGSRLVVEGLQASRRLGQRIVLVLGHPQFYSRFGFSPELARPLKSPFGGGDAWMALELVSGALAGVCGSVVYASPFDVFQKEDQLTS